MFSSSQEQHVWMAKWPCNFLVNRILFIAKYWSPQTCTQGYQQYFLLIFNKGMQYVQIFMPSKLFLSRRKDSKLTISANTISTVYTFSEYSRHGKVVLPNDCNDESIDDDIG